MSTNLKTANLDESVLEYKLINDIRLAAANPPTAIVDVTQESGSLYYLSLDASNCSNAQWLNLYLVTSEIAVGTTHPDVHIKIPATTRFKMSFPAGLPFTALSASLLTTSENTATANTEAAANRFAILNVVTS
jgi:hypothetical protein